MEGNLAENIPRPGNGYLDSQIPSANFGHAQHASVPLFFVLVLDL
jgi:hypothetical protein